MAEAAMRRQEFGELSDELDSAVRTAAACLRAIDNGAEGQDAAYLHAAAVDALQKGEAALEAHLAAFVERVRC